MLMTHFCSLNVKVTLGTHRHSWKDIIKIDVEVVWDGVNWIDLVQDSDKWLAVMILQWTFAFNKTREFLTSWGNFRFSRTTWLDGRSGKDVWNEAVMLIHSKTSRCVVGDVEINVSWNNRHPCVRYLAKVRELCSYSVASRLCPRLVGIKSFGV
jgi:hypothetical protein